MTSVIVTLLRRKGDKQGNNFVGTSESPGEWSLLIQNEELKSQGVTFVTIEYDDLRSLMGRYGKINRSPYIDFRLNNEEADVRVSESYPQGKPLLASNLAAFAVDFLKRNSAGGQVNRSVNADAAPSGAIVKAASVETTPSESQVPVSAWRTPIMVAGSLLALAGIAAAGFLLWDWRKKNTVSIAETAPLFMTGQNEEEDKPVDFELIRKNIKY